MAEERPEHDGRGEQVQHEVDVETGPEVTAFLRLAQDHDARFPARLPELGEEAFPQFRVVREIGDQRAEHMAEGRVVHRVPERFEMPDDVAVGAPGVDLHDPGPVPRHGLDDQVFLTGPAPADGGFGGPRPLRDGFHRQARIADFPYELGHRGQYGVIDPLVPPARHRTLPGTARPSCRPATLPGTQDDLAERLSVRHVPQCGGGLGERENLIHHG